MKLIDTGNLQEILLPDDLLWVDEFNWQHSVSKSIYSLTGSLLIQASRRQKGRKMTFEAPTPQYGWVERSVVTTLQGWVDVNPTRVMSLELNYALDNRTFGVVFRHEDGAFEAEPVLGVPDRHASDSWYRIKLRLMEVV